MELWANFRHLVYAGIGANLFDDYHIHRHNAARDFAREVLQLCIDKVPNQNVVDLANRLLTLLSGEFTDPGLKDKPTASSVLIRLSATLWSYFESASNVSLNMKQKVLTLAYFF